MAKSPFVVIVPNVIVLLMKLGKSFTGMFLLILAAALGVALIYLPNWIITNYERASSLGDIWGTAYLVVVGVGFALVLGSVGWTFWKLWGRSVAKKIKRQRRNRNPSELSREQKRREIDENLETIGQLRDAHGNPLVQAELDPLVNELEQKREAQTLEIVAFGTISSGKSSILNLLAGRDVFQTDVRGGTTITRSEIPWPGADKVFLVDTPGLGEVDGADHVVIAADSAKDADLVLVVVDGPLRESEFTLLEKLGQMEKRVIVCLNKSDWYEIEDRDKLIGQIAKQTRPFVREHDVVAVQAETAYRTRKRVLADGTESDEQVPIDPDIDPLGQRMLQIVKKDGKELLMANVLLQSRGLVEKARDRVKKSLDENAWRTVDKYMWGAGGLAAVSPWPLVDLAAGCAVSTKMIVDLSEIYGQKVDLETAAKWLGEMGKNLIGVVGATGASVGVAAIVGSMVKTVPVAGTIAGGVLQGAVQALITKWIGATFIEYFRNEMQTPEGGLAGLARRQWENVTSINELRQIVKAARDKFRGIASE
jgi:uncharacterized protein (DUF697 family)/GTP-binding protein EngB required for normal cell division